MNTAALAADVADALEELERAYPGSISLEPDDVGGIYVTITGIELGGRWTADTTTLTFHLPYNYPAAAPYPYYLPADLDLGGAWPTAPQRIRWRDRDVIQVSLRHNQWDPQRDRVIGCVMQVCAWLRNQ
jgi:hypothetical protein